MWIDAETFWVSVCIALIVLYALDKVVNWKKIEVLESEHKLAVVPACGRCDGTSWVCEGHDMKPSATSSTRLDACDCGPGVPCPDCSPLAAALC